MNYNTFKDNLDETTYFKQLDSLLNLCPCVFIHYIEDIIKLCVYSNKIPQRVVSWVYNSNLLRQHRCVSYFDIKPNFNQMKQPYTNYNDPKIKERVKKGFRGGKLYDWWFIPHSRNSQKKGICHPCILPTQLMVNTIGVLPKDSTIIDCFMGSGTTGMACKELGYNFVGIELDKDYYNLSKKRIGLYNPKVTTLCDFFSLKGDAD